MIAKNLISLFEDSFKKHWTITALSNYEGESYTYGQVATEVARWHDFFASQGLQHGDKVALMAKDSAEWAIFFVAVITYGCVIVPVLQDFPPQDAMQIITHSEAKLLAINSNLWEAMTPEGVPFIATVLEVQTSNNFAGNLVFCLEQNIIRAGETLLCFLPMAHVYSCMINLFLALVSGTHVVVLGKVPSPKILGAAFRKVRPTVVISVPLVLKKIYQNVLQPVLKSRKVRLMLALPIVRNIVYRKIREQLTEGMGGAFRQVIVGGAALNPEVGEFLKRIGFPITVGYGMTECAPLISYVDAKDWRLRSCGQVLHPYMEARIAPLDEETQRAHGEATIGEIQVRGENVCMGYYKNPEQTAALFTEDGRLRTGDLGTMDSDLFLYIRGRSKAMLLGGNGQNIYPEELEAKIGMLRFVQESLVLMREGRLEALIVPNTQLIEEEGLTLEQGWQIIQDQRASLNEQVGSYEKIQRFELRLEPFEKTPKQSIRRYLYK